MSVSGQRTSERRLLVTDRLPVPAGASPFHVKGHVYQKMIADFEASVTGGVLALLERIGDATITEFATQHFMASSWYDALPMMPLSLAHARALGLPFHQHLRDRGRWVAENDVPGIYRVILRLASPDLVISRLPRAAMQYFNFGRSETVTVRQGLARVSQEGVPQTLVPVIAATTEGFVCATMEMAGGRRVQVRCIEATKDGDRGGVQTSRIVVEVAWE